MLNQQLYSCTKHFEHDTALIVHNHKTLKNKDIAIFLC